MQQGKNEGNTQNRKLLQECMRNHQFLEFVISFLLFRLFPYGGKYLRYQCLKLKLLDIARNKHSKPYIKCCNLEMVEQQSFGAVQDTIQIEFHEALKI